MLLIIVSQSCSVVVFLNLFRYICGHADWDRAQNTGNKYIASVYSVPLQAVVPVLCFGRRTHELVAIYALLSLDDDIVKCKDIFCIYPFAVPRLMRLW